MDKMNNKNYYLKLYNINCLYNNITITPTEKKNETKLTLFFDNVIAPLQA